MANIKLWVSRKVGYFFDAVKDVAILALLVIAVIGIGIAVTWPLWAGLAAIKFIFN